MTPAQPDTMIRLNKLVRATPQRVYEAWTTPEQFPHWFAPGPHEHCTNVVVEPRIGGRFHFEMNTQQGKHIGSGVFTQVIENQKLAFTWTWEDNPEFGGDSLVTIELFEAENPYEPGEPATEVVLTHERLNSAAERSEHTGGWWNTLRALGYYVRGVDPREAMFGQTAAASS